jgi:acyl CoA:acetate/3-ketoacid CoA transferase alpha subunit
MLTLNAIKMLKLDVRCFLSNIKRKFLSTPQKNSTERNEALDLNIPNKSVIKIGGYLNVDVPNKLISALANGRAFGLTLITNASVLDNQELRDLFNIEGKVTRLITSLEYNRLAATNNQLAYPFQLDMMDSLGFLKEFSFDNTIENVRSGRSSDFSLVKSKYADEKRNLFGDMGSSFYFNEVFSRSAKSVTIAEADLIVSSNQIDKQKTQLIANGCFVDKIHTSLSASAKKHNNTYKYEYSEDDLALIVKRLLLEFQNNFNIYTPLAVNEIIEKFYKPKYIHTNFLSACMRQRWPTRPDWLSYARMLNLCIIEAKSFGEHGELFVDASNMDGCLASDIIDHLPTKAKLIAIVRLKDRIFDLNQGNRLKLLKRCADSILTECGVFKPNEKTNAMELVEYTGAADMNDTNRMLDLCTFRPNISENVKEMLQQTY